MIDIQDWITKEYNLFKEHGMGGAWLLHEFLLRNGKKFFSQPKPRRYKMRMAKFCFHNSRELVSRSKGKLRYAEGYIVSPDLPLLIHHAWCVDGEDRVIDVTLRDYQTGESRAGAAQYFGLVIPKSIWPKDDSLSVLDSGVGYRIDAWLKIDPGFRTFLDEAKENIFGAKASSLNPTK
jgi:hypothetical protein